MNKQEFQQKIKNMEPPKNFTFISAHDAYEKGFEKAKGTALFNSYFLNEPEKPVIPQFVADWIEDNREALEEYVFTNIRVVLPVIPAENPMYKWLDGKGIGVIVDCIRNGYEVEKEKLYTARLKLVTYKSQGYINKTKETGNLFVAGSDESNSLYQVHFTQAELEELNVWDNPAFEVEEVKK